MKTAHDKVSRRRFLLAATAGTAAGAAALVGTRQADTPLPNVAGSEAKKGYQLTEHVRNYYRTAKI